VSKYDHIDFTPPKGVREEAARGLAWRQEYGRGGTEVGVARARDLSNGRAVSPETARRMASYFARHEVDKQGQGWSPGQSGFPSAGRIAWALWGGDAGQAFASRLVKQIDAADNRSSSTMELERRYFSFAATGEDSTKFLRIEQRAAGDEQRTYVTGYAARFGVDSLDGAVGDFVERIAPGAFALVDDANERGTPLMCKALWNHNDDMPLAAYPDTLRVWQDDIGLGFAFPVSRASYSQDLVVNIEDGIVRGNSFAFLVDRENGGEEWSVDREGRSIRTIKRVSLVPDVGPCTYPAYGEGDLDVARRSFSAFRKTQTRKVIDLAPYRAKRAELSQYLNANGR
jgi:HK97 family phage prohead protease